MIKSIRSRGVALAACAGIAMFAIQPAFAVSVGGTTGLVFAGGCSEDVGNPFCGMGSNATEENVAEFTGVDASAVTQISSGFSVSGIGGISGIWSVTDPSITHLAFKSNGYYILGRVTAAGGTWDNDTTAFAGWDISLVNCPASVCGVERAYTTSDFLNGGGNIADLSNARAFSVVPIPAAVWLFGSALGFLGWMKRKPVA